MTWTVATIIPIPKPDKYPSILLNYQPISLTNCLCKLIEFLLNIQLAIWIQRKTMRNELYCTNVSKTEEKVAFLAYSEKF